MRKVDSNPNRKQSIVLKLATDRGALYKGDCLALLSAVDANTIDCIFADPPFNLGKSYGSDTITDQLPDEAYLKWTRQWLDECIRVLKLGGSLFVYHIPRRLIQIASYLDSFGNMEFRDWIAVKMKNGFPIKNRLHPAHYGLLYYTKRGNKPRFHVIRIPSPVCRHCGGLIRDYGGYRKKYKTLKGNKNVPLIQLDDIWDDTTPNIHRKSRPKGINELPLTVSERAILISTNRGDILLDPFAGGGSTLYAAQTQGRYWIGSELGTTRYAVKKLSGAPLVVVQSTLPERLQRIFRKDTIGE
jgi:site-specific DNA-methyltransferase (adenine-specific)